MRLIFLSIVYIALMAIRITPVECEKESTSRAKRALAFRKGSTFFYRLNYKIASISTTTIFAQATGFKVSWQLPTKNSQQGSSRQYYRRNVRDVHESAELLYESHGFDGKSCLAKNICQALEYTNKGRDGVMVKILKLLAKKSYVTETNTTSIDPLACKEHSVRCPLDLMGINSFAEYQ